MPSNKSPAAVVQPGPGRLPADTVPANALIFPPSGSSDAALQAHIQDTLNAHMATAIGASANSAWPDATTNPAADVQVKLEKIITDLSASAGSAKIGQPGFSGLTRSISAGEIADALNRLNEADNARAVFVVGSSTADSDFTNLDTAVQALDTAGVDAILYLRSGSYTLTNLASTFWDNLIIIGEDPTNTTLTGAVQWTPGENTQVYNCTISTTGGVEIQGSNGIFRNCINTSDITFASGANNNLWEHITIVPLATPFVTVDSGADYNTFHNISDHQFDISGDYTTLDGYTLTPGNGLSDPTTAFGVVNINSSFVTVRNALFTGVIDASLNLPLLRTLTTSTHCRFENIVIDGVPSTPSQWTYMWIRGPHARVSNLSVLNANGLSGFTIQIQVDGDYPIVENVRFDTITNCDGSLLQLGTSSAEGTVNGVEITNVSLPSGNLNGVSAGTGTKVTNVRASNVDMQRAVLGKTVKSVTVTSGTFSSSVVVADHLVDLFISNTTCLNVLSIGDHGVAQEVTLDNITCTGEAVSFTSAFGGVGPDIMVSNWIVDNLDTVGGSTLFALDLDTIKSFVAENIRAERVDTLLDVTGTPAVGNVSSEGENVVLRSVRLLRTGGISSDLYEPIKIQTTGRVSITDFSSVSEFAHNSTSVAVTITDSPYVSMRNCDFYLRDGAAAVIINSGVELDGVTFSSENAASSGSNIQFFSGYGYTGTRPRPLTIRNSRMIIGDNNIDGATAGNPVIFLGGTAGTTPADHGSVQVDGLNVILDSDVPRGTLMAIDTVNTPVDPLVPTSSFRNITIDMGNNVSIASGVGNSIPGVLNTSPGLLEIQGPDSSSVSQVRPIVENLSFVRVNWGALDDSRYVLKSEGSIINGLVIDGATIAGGAGSFGNDMVSVGYTTIKNLDIFPTSTIEIRSDLLNCSTKSVVDTMHVKNLTPGLAYIAVVDFDSILSNLNVVTSTSNIDSAFILVSESIVKNCHFDLTVDSTATIFQLGTRSILSDNRVEMSGGDGDVITLCSITSSDSLVANNTTIWTSAVGFVSMHIIGAGAADYSRILGNYFQSPEDLEINPTGASNLIISNNILRALSGQVEWNIDNCDNSVISNNRLQGSSDSEILILNGSDNCSITGNNLTGSGSVQIQLNNSSDCLVVGNLLNDSSGTGSVNESGTGVGTHTLANNELV